MESPGRIRLVTAVLSLTLLSLVAVPARADDPRAELEKATNKLEFIQQAQQRAKNELAQAFWRAEEAKIQLREVEADLAVANAQLAVITNQMTFAESDLKQVESDLVETKARMEERKELVARRVRAIHEMGRVNYLPVLLRSGSIADFIGRYEALRMVVAQDARLFGEARRDRLVLEERQKRAADRRNQLAALRTQLQERRATVVARRDERGRITAELELLKASLNRQIEEFEADEERLRKEVARIQAELARQAGRFVPGLPLPSPLQVSDDYGPGLDPITGRWRQHDGSDYQAQEGTPIYAVEDGLVILAGDSGSYGLLVVIDHGGGLSTWYAHASQLLVRSGTTVKRGQLIARVGSTGKSTGPHLHLEVRRNGNPEDPAKYLGKFQSR